MLNKKNAILSYLIFIHPIYNSKFQGILLDNVYHLNPPRVKCQRQGKYSF